MLSILIPVYNYNITRLVYDLHQQAEDAYVDFEILVMEDGSTQFLEKNSVVADLPFCHYTVLTENIGRSAIRNRLADEAKYGHLLFLDCDGDVISPHFVEKYLSFCRENSVVIGGTAYDPENNNPDFSLRLKYGRIREAAPAIKREKKDSELHFSAFNFLIPKKIFNQVRFEEEIKGYGHEDTLFGHKIAQLGSTVHHIDNPLLHKGLDNNLTFIRKTEESVKNLYLLHQTGKYPFLENHSKLLRIFNQVQKLKLTHLLAVVFSAIKPTLNSNLTSSIPSLRLFDIYKLLYLCHIATQKRHPLSANLTD